MKAIHTSIVLGLLLSLGAAIAFLASRHGQRDQAAPSGPRHDATKGVVAEAEPTVLIENDLIEEDLFRTADQFTPLVSDEGSIHDRAEAIHRRVRSGLDELLPKYAALCTGTGTSTPEVFDLALSIAYLYMYNGDYDSASSWLEKARAAVEPGDGQGRKSEQIEALLGVVALRKGEQDNCIACVGPSSCIFPIEPTAVHKNQAGSREAIRRFTQYLEHSPGDLRVRWLLNLAYMTVGEYPAGVPKRDLIPVHPLGEHAGLGRFTNVATLAGLTARGPGLAGGSIFDDFTGDNLPDILATSIDVDRGASLFVNRGDGTFEDRSHAAGLDNQPYALNARRADYDNDGLLDVVLLRGGWERPARLTLLRNTGGAFEDMTRHAGMAEPIATESAEWGDFDNDGYVDLFVCGEYRPDSTDARNLCRLYRNLGNGKFEDVAASAGVLNDRYAKGAAWFDFDRDGDLDLYVSNMSLPAPMSSRLYRNNGDGTFSDVASSLGISGEFHHFTCVSWDYDNDGWPDLLVSDYHDTLAEVVGSYMGLQVKTARHPFLYRNNAGQGFEDVSTTVGLDRPIPAMSLNIADLNQDGWLDLHFGSGWMAYSGLFPDLTFVNHEGTRFDDVTQSTGTGHLQKGHGVSFADWDCDGDQDLLVIYGGGYPGDKAYPALFQNPAPSDGHYLKVKLVGTRTNRAALGARIQARIRSADGDSRTIYRTIGDNGSFGGNSLVAHIGLGAESQVSELAIEWPGSGTTQILKDIAGQQTIEITEGVDGFKPLDVKPVLVPEAKTAH